MVAIEAVPCLRAYWFVRLMASNAAMSGFVLVDALYLGVVPAIVIDWYPRLGALGL